MSTIVNDKGFAQDDWDFDGAEILDLESNADPATVELDGIRAVRVAFPSSADGRGFTIARQLRLRGFDGRLRAAGHVLSDQYAMARRAGFDDVEISDDLAERQPEAHWQARADWRAHSYQARLRG